jgi:hypothetical protein
LGWWRQTATTQTSGYPIPRWAFAVYLLAGLAVLAVLWAGLPVLGVRWFLDYGRFTMLPVVIGYHLVVLWWWSTRWPGPDIGEDRSKEP